jgi:hypothetical protein
MSDDRELEPSAGERAAAAKTQALWDSVVEAALVEPGVAQRTMKS